MRFVNAVRHPRTLIATAVLAIGVATFAWLGRATPAGSADGTTFDGPSPLPLPPRRTLRVATFNIDGGHGTDGKLDLTRTAKSVQRMDVVAFQEVHASSDVDNQAVPLSAQLHLPFLFAPAERRWGHDSFGNAVLTRLPVTAWHRVQLPDRPFAAKRNYVAVDLTWQDRPLHVIATHVDYKANGDQQLAAVVRDFLALPEPAVLLGDLNHPADSPQIRQLIATPGVEECYGRLPDLDPVPGRVDWIFVRGLRTVDAGSVDGLHASDHPAYWAEVALPPAIPSTRP